MCLWISGSEPPDTALEQAGIAALQYQENMVDHLVSCAQTYCKINIKNVQKDVSAERISIALMVVFRGSKSEIMPKLLNS